MRVKREKKMMANLGFLRDISLDFIKAKSDQL